MSGRAEVLLEGARIRTMDEARPQAEALAIANGRILGIGTSEELSALVGPETQRVDLSGRVIVPGFTDAHTHVWKVGNLLTHMLDLRQVRSLGELLEAVGEKYAGLEDGAWLVGRGYNEALLPEGRGPTREELDVAAPRRAVFLTRTCGHIAVASSAALESAGITRSTAAPSGGRILVDESGEPTGELHETAMSLVRSRIPDPTPEALEEMVLAACRHLLTRGITCATDAGVSPTLQAVYRRLAGEGRLSCRIHAMAIRTPLDGAGSAPLPEKLVSDRLRIDTVKLFADGGLSGATAALSENYRGLDHAGLLRLDGAGMVELAREAHAGGLRIAVHAIGDRAIDETLDALEEIQGGRPGPGHRIEHCGLPSREQLKRMRDLNIRAIPQAIFLHELAGNFRRYLPESFLPRTYPLRDMVDVGVDFALSSDAPVVRSDDPLVGMQAAILRAAPGEEPLAPEQALTAAEALEAYTLGGARATGDAEERGKLAAGYRADMAVLDGDPLGTEPARLHELRVVETWLGGEKVYELREGE